MTTVTETLQKLAQEGGLDAETSAAVLKALGNQQFTARLGAEFVPRAEYSRSMDSLRADQQKFEGERQQWLQWYEGAKLTDTQRGAALEQYRQRFGDLSQPTASAIDPSKYVSVEAFQKAIAEATNRATQINTSILKDALWAQSHYQQTFGKPLDLDALEKAALTAGKPLKDAYRDFIQADLDTKTKTDYDAAIAKAKADGATEALSKHNLPVDGVKTEGHVLFDALERDKAAQPLSERQRAQNFAEEWNKAATAA